MNNISFNLTLGQIITIILCLLAFIILIQLIFLLKKAFPMMNKLNKILDDTAVVTEMAADGAMATKETVSEINETIKSLTGSVKNNKAIISSISAFINAIAKLKGNVKSK